MKRGQTQQTENFCPPWKNRHATVKNPQIFTARFNVGIDGHWRKWRQADNTFESQSDGGICAVTQQVAPLRNKLYCNATIKISLLFYRVYDFTFIYPKPIPTRASPTRMNRYPLNRCPWHNFCFILSRPHNIISRIVSAHSLSTSINRLTRFIFDTR